MAGGALPRPGAGDRPPSVRRAACGRPRGGRRTVRRAGRPARVVSLAPAAWRALLRPGDVLVVLGGLLLCGYSLMVLWQGGRPDAAIVRAGGKVVAEVDLRTARIIDVPGPIGTTRIEIQPGRARVAADPGP